MKISIICPVYNKEPYIEQCINSVVNQTYTNWELILVDDESPDNCPKICDGYAELDARIKVIHQKNKGHSESRNVGIRASQGEYLMFLDADDFLYDSYVLENMYNYTINNNLDVCLSQIATLKKDGELVNSTFKYLEIPYEKLSGTEVLCEMINAKNYHASMCSRLFKKDLICQNNLFFKKLICDDEEWTPKVFYYANRIGFLNKDCYVIRKLDTSVTGSNDVRTCSIKIIDKVTTAVLLMKSFEKFNLTKEQKQILYAKFYSFMNMAVYSYLKNATQLKNAELKTMLKQQMKEVAIYRNELDIKNNIMLFFSRILVALK